MKKLLSTGYYSIAAIILLSACSGKDELPSKKANAYKPDQQALYDTIVIQDSLFFHAYNTCDMATQAAMYADSIEFYHDQGGLMTDKQLLLQKTKENICGKVTRELVPGSIEVYPIKNFGAIEMGLHKFHNNQEKDAVSHESKFIIIWKQQSNGWKLSRVISLH